MNNNERLAEIIESKLLEKGLIVENNSDFKNKLSSGNLKDVDWKFLLEDVTSIWQNPQAETIETQQEDKTE